MTELHTPLRVAHRGGSALAPENTLGAFQQALTYPVDALEGDLHLTHDGEVVVFHDATLDRVTNGTGNIQDFQSSELAVLNAAARWPDWPREPVPTLRALLSFARGHCRLFLELKNSERDGHYARYEQLPQFVAAEIARAGMQDQVMVMAFDWAYLATLRQYAPDIELGALLGREQWKQAGGDLTRIVTEVRRLGCRWLHLQKDLCTTELVQQVHDVQLKLGLWTVNSLAELQYFKSIGVDALTSDSINLFIDL